MREITFRGKTYDGMWIEGAYYHANKNYGDPDDVHCIIPTTESLDYEQALEYFPVMPSTVGQYTGLKDKNGKRIFEGDIVNAKVTENTWDGIRKYTSTYEIAYHKEHCYFYLKHEKNNLLFDGNWSYFVSRHEIIGNIHDNPELMEVR